MDVSIDSPDTTLTPGKLARTAKRTCCVFAPGASSSSTPEILSGSSGALLPQICCMVARMSASVGKVMNKPRSWVPTAVLAELAVNGQRPAEDQQFRADRFFAPSADDHIALAQRPVEMLFQPWLDGDIARRIERDQIDDFAASFIARGVGAEDKLRRRLLHAFERFEAV